MPLPTTPDPPAWRDRVFFKNMEAIRPYVQWMIVVAALTFGIYTSQRDTNAQNVVSNSDLAKGQLQIRAEMDQRKQFVDQQLADIRANMVTAKEFQAWKDAVNQRMDWQDRMLT